MPTTARPRQVGKALGLDLVEVSNWNCCGAMEVKNIDPKIQTYLSSRVMSIAANEMGMDVVMAPCNGCYHNLKKAEHDLAHDPTSAEVVGRLSEKAGHDDLPRRARSRPSTRSTGSRPRSARTACASACATASRACGSPTTTAACTRGRATSSRRRTPGPGSESTSKPHFMDDLLAAAGAVNVEFPLKTACCGGAHTLSDSDTSTKLVLNILRAAEAAGAEVIATECPTCHSGLEMHQIRADKNFGQQDPGEDHLLHAAAGHSRSACHARQVGLHENVSDSFELLKAKGLA